MQLVQRAEPHEVAALMFQRSEDIERAIRCAPVPAIIAKQPFSGWTLNYNGGTFTRALEASYQTSAPTTGAAPFISWASANVRVFEDLGDGAGALLRIEGARTNLVKASRDITDATYWTTPPLGVWTVTTGQVSPDGAAAAVRLQSGTWWRSQTPVGLANPNTLSAWVRSNSGTSPTGPNYPGSTRSWAITATTTYARPSKTTTNTASAYFPSDTTLGGGAQDVILDLHQIENGIFPSSVIRTTTATVTRDADVLTFTTSQVAPELFTRAAQFLQVSPEFANTDLASGDKYWLWAIDANNGVLITHDGTGVCVQAVVGGAVKAQSGYLTFARYALLGAVKWNPVTAIVSVNGVAGAAGTAWTWTPGTIRVGGIPSSTGEAFCRLGTLQSALP